MNGRDQSVFVGVEVSGDGSWSLKYIVLGDVSDVVVDWLVYLSLFFSFDALIQFVRHRITHRRLVVIHINLLFIL